MRNGFRALAVAMLAGAALLAPAAQTATRDTIPPRRYLSPNGQDVDEFLVAGNDRGDQAALWRAHDGRLRVRSRRHGRPFGRARTLTRKGATAFSSAVDVGPDGTEMAAWVRSRRGGIVLEAAARRRGGSFTQPKVLDRRPRFLEEVRVAVGSDGGAVVVWTEELGRSREALRAAVRSPRGTWSRPESVTTSRSVKLSLNVAVDRDGNATLAWEGGGVVRRAIRPAGGRFGRPRAVSIGRRLAVDPVLAENARGDAVVLWRQTVDDEHERVAYAFRRAGRDFGPSHPLTPQLVFSQIGGAGVDPEGNVVALWSRFPSGKEARCFCLNVMAARRTVGGEFEHPRRLANDAAGFATPSTSADRNGDVFAAWPVDTERNENFVTQAQGRLVSADGRLGPKRRFSRRQHMYGDPEALLARGGRALVAWIARSNRHDRLAAARGRVESPRIEP
ncbi:MAG TPA: hypothetical protein VJT75_00240 [Thermoleophilaceae bacterium]|nr:hypothetical protein [Thermoleophilaceae bacterium]